MSQKVKCPRCKNVFSLEDAHEHEIKNLKEKAKKEALAEAQAERVKADKEKNKIKQDYEKKLQTKEKEHALDMKRVKEKQKIAFDIASQTAVEKKGEAQEELLEDFLKDKFPYDKIEPVKKGKRGGDLIQTVIDKQDNQTGKILHERKEVLKFDEQWVDKLLKDMSSIDATQGIIFTK